MKLEITLKPKQNSPPPPQEGDRLPSGKQFAYLYHDYDLYGLSRPSRNGSPIKTQGLPETIKCLNPKFVPITEKWQYFWVDQFSLSLYGVLYKELGSYARSVINAGFASATTGYRAFTNGHGWNNGYADYINKVNVGSPPMEQETIITGGNVVELLSGKIRMGGKDVYKVRTLNGKQNPPNPLEVNFKTTPWLVFKATISRREDYNPTTGKWGREDVVIPFPQLQGHDVPIPFMYADDFNYIEAERIKPLPDNSLVPYAYNY